MKRVLLSILACLLIVAGWTYAEEFVNGVLALKTVSEGGTGASSFTDGGILTGNGTGPIQAMPVLTDGQLLVGDGTTEPTAAQPAESEFIPISWFVFDGTTDPDSLTEEDNLRYRDFDSSTAEEGEFIWQVPGNISGSTVKIRAIAVVTNATTPADGEGVSWGIAACSSGTNDNHDCTVGTEVNSEDSDLDDDAGAQWDLIYFPYVEVTPTNLAASEMMKIAVQRDVADTADDYGQDIGLIGVEIKYAVDFATQTY